MSIADRRRLIALVGPTAAGKTELAIDLALRLDAEVVSVDSRQVYRLLDIGTAKPDAAARATVPHHLLDVVDPDARFDAAEYARLARAAIADIHGRGKRVLLCGGSGLYLRALLHGLCSAPGADAGVREQLRQALAEQGVLALHAELRAADPEAAARISPRDAVRTCRALEVLRTTGRPISAWQGAHRFGERPYEVQSFVLSPPVKALDERILHRTEAMWRHGLLQETARVLAAGFDPDLPALQSIGYREAQLHLRAELDADRAVAAIRLATRRYAKRQRTWFRTLENAVWLDGAEDPAALADQAERFLAGEHGAAHVS